MWGAAQMRFAAVANRFGARYRHLIVSLDGVDSARGRLAPGLEIAFPPPPAGRATLAALRRTLQALRPDVLITHNWGSMDWAIANLPGLVRHIHIEDEFGPRAVQRSGTVTRVSRLSMPARAAR